MSSKATTPYRNDRDFLKDQLHLMELRQRRYTLKTRAKEWEEEGFFEHDLETEMERQRDINRVEADIRRLTRKINEKLRASKAKGITFSLFRMKRKYGLDDLDVDILLVLLLEDITVSGAKTYSRGKDILGVLLDDRMAVLEARTHLYQNSPLMRNGLIACSSTDDSTVLDAYFKVSERAVLEITSGMTSPEELVDAQDHLLATGQIVTRRRVRQPRYTLDDVVLPPRVRRQIDDILALARHADLLLNDWGFGHVYSRQGLTTVLFEGLPGTGKTMTAEAIAHALGQPIMMVNYAELVSKWVGDTEKNIVTIFAEAQNEQAVLLFDEADAMFHTRVDVSSATDQSFNREVNVLLQEVERFEGVLILTTNRYFGLDSALERRIRMRVHFPMPDAQAREEIWRKHVPPSAPLADDVDFTELARRFEFSGGHIRNAVLKAAVAAAQRAHSDGGRITMADFLRAAEAEAASARHVASGRRIGFAGHAAGAPQRAPCQ